ANPVVCGATDQCHVVGACDPGSGICSNPPAPDGALCNDGNACTQVDACEGGACVGAAPVVCVSSDQCHAQGVCDPASGMCTNPTVADGAMCDDGDACSRSDTCESGMCVGSDRVMCAASDQCHTGGVCDPSTGVCTNPSLPDGASCNDGNSCTQADIC